ncbi:hypothetical protein BC834DRAFT_421580 [Gloeopeniophorella convolvens]|nr:hypothetical protein BC834DRAFT_421580 [Gloeopeniophorella convolvens]
MQWQNLLAKLSPERAVPPLRDGQCRPVSNYRYVTDTLRDNLSDPQPLDPRRSKASNMSSSDPHEAPQEEAQPGEQDERDSIIGSSLLEPPMSRRPRHPRVVPHPDLQIRLPSVEGHAASHDASMPLATIPVFEHVATPSLSMHPTSFSDRPHNALVTTRLRSYTSTSNAPPMLQAVVYHDGYAPVGSLPPQNFVPPPQSAPSSGAPFFPPPFHGSSFPSSVQVNAALSASISGPSAVIPPNSELALPPRFTFAPAGADVPADPVATASTQATPMNTRRREKETRKLEMTVQTQAESTRRPRSNSWNVVSSVFRRKSGGLAAQKYGWARADYHRLQSDHFRVVRAAFRPELSRYRYRRRPAAHG